VYFGLNWIYNVLKNFLKNKRILYILFLNFIFKYIIRIKIIFYYIYFKKFKKLIRYKKINKFLLYLLNEYNEKFYFFNKYVILNKKIKFIKKERNNLNKKESDILRKKERFYMKKRSELVFKRK